MSQSLATLHRGSAKCGATVRDPAVQPALLTDMTLSCLSTELITEQLGQPPNDVKRLLPATSTLKETTIGQ